MNYKQAINESIVETQKPSTYPSFMTCGEAIQELLQIHNKVQKTNVVNVSNTRIIEAITSIYHELHMYWSEFGIIDQCSFERFKRCICDICIKNAVESVTADIDSDD